MENSPLSTDNDSEPKETKDNRKKKHKNAESLGVFAMRPKGAQDSNDSAEEIWNKLKLTRRKGGVSEEVQSLSELTVQNPENEAEARSDSEDVPESEAPLDDLSDTEKHYVEREISISHSATEELEQEREDGETREPDFVVDAIELFYDKIVNEEQDADHAFAEVMDILRHPGTDIGDEEAIPEHMAPANRARHENENSLYNVGAVSTDRPESPQPPPRSSSGKSATRPLSYVRPRATAIPPRGTGMYRLNSMASGPGFPVQEYMRGYDEITLGNIPGAIVGYLIGRRRGRIKAEKDFRSVKKKMEKKVKEVEEDISMKEAQIRNIAREPRTESESEPVRRAEALEANQLHGKKLPAERIGHVVIAGEPAPMPEPVNKNKKDTDPSAKVLSSRVATMSRSELLDLSEEISVDNTTLRHVYNSHLIGENGLRRLVYEHARGGNVKETLHREMLEHGTEYERDPQLRRRVETDKPQRAGQEENKSLKELLKKSGMIGGDTDDSVVKSSSRPKVEQTIREAKHKTKQFRALDMAFSSIILILLVLVIMLIVTRG